MKMKPIMQFLIGVSFVAISACGGSGGGGGGGDDDVFPTPTLPSSATKIDAMNAEDIADSALEFIDILSEFSAKTEGPLSIPQVIKLLTDQATKSNRYLGSVAAAKTEDLSAIFCFTGTAIDTFTENTNSASGEIKFSNCDIGDGIVLNGTFPYEGSWNDTTLDYNLHIGGTLTFDFGTDLVTVVLNFTESGNDGTGNFSFSPSFSLAGIPGEGYLVTTVQPLLGNFFSDELTSGKLKVEGADNTQLCMTVTAINTVTVEFDDGLGGGCVPLVPALVITL
jgi:hypothetical protein